MGERINTYKELHVYQNAMEAAMEIFELTKGFPVAEKYSMVDQIRRCSRSVCANLGEAWRKRRYRAAFISKLSDSETEAGEVQVWLEFALRCKYIEKTAHENLDAA
jgi:four helix bundle protein